MVKPLNDIDIGAVDFDDLIGLPQKNKGDLISNVVKGLVSKEKQKSQNPLEHDRLWHIHKLFAQLYDKFGKFFAFFLGDILDIVLIGPIQEKLVSEMMEEKINKLRKTKEAKDLKDSKAGSVQRKTKVPTRPKTVYDVEIGSEKRVFAHNFLKRKKFLSNLFLDSDEYLSYKKLMNQIILVCNEEISDVPQTKEQRVEALNLLLDGFKYEILRHEVVKMWALLEKDDFKNLEWVFEKARNYHFVRPDFYEDLDKAYREGKKMIKLLIEDIKSSFPPDADKQDAYLDYLKTSLNVYTHHHFVLKYFYQVRPGVTLKDFELSKEEMRDKVDELREEIEAQRRSAEQMTLERDAAISEAREHKTQNEEIKQKLKRLDPAEVQKQLLAADAKTNALNRELQAAIEEYSELKTDMKKLDQENQQLTKKLQELKAIPDEAAYSVENLLTGRRVAIFGGVGRDHYWPVLNEAGVLDEDYEWFEGYHTISQSRTAEIVGRCDLIVVVTSYAGHLLLYQIRPCIKSHQHFFKIHNSGAGSLRKEILSTFKK